jgi:phage gp36-like protein
MAYCVEADFTARFGTTELSQVLDLADGRTFAAAADDASSIIDSYLASVPGRNYVLPLTAPIPGRVLELACDIARYKLWGQAAPDIVKARYDAAIEFLKGVAAGELAIVGLEEEPVVGASGAIDYYAKDRVFTDDSLEGY